MPTQLASGVYSVLFEESIRVFEDVECILKCNAVFTQVDPSLVRIPFEPHDLRLIITPNM